MSVLNKETTQLSKKETKAAVTNVTRELQESLTIAWATRKLTTLLLISFLNDTKHTMQYLKSKSRNCKPLSTTPLYEKVYK